MQVKTLLDTKADAAFPVMIRKLMPIGLRGFMFAAIAGAVISSLASMLNSTSTVFTMDVYKRLLHHDKDNDRHLIWIGRITILASVAIGCSLAPMLDNPKFGGVFQYIQQFQGYIWPGVVAAFVFGLWSPRTPRFAGVVALVLGPVFYFILQRTAEIHHLHFLLQVLIDFVLLSIILGAATLVHPLSEPAAMPVRNEMETRTSWIVYLAGIFVLAGVAWFYILFW
jgi:SSS family solute:Na+ symporter